MVSKATPPNILATDSHGLFQEGERVGIPLDSTELKIKLLVMPHMGGSGHKGVESTFQVLEKRVIWTNLKVEVEWFVHSCLYCEVLASRKLMPSPLGEAVDGEFPSEVLHFDFLYMETSHKPRILPFGS